MGPDRRRWSWRGALAVVVVFGLLGLAAPSALATSLTWGPGVTAVPPSDNGSPARAGITAISCPSPGNCTAVGGYVNTSAFDEGILVTESGGTWGNGVMAPLPANASSGFPGPGVGLTSVSCVSAGNCVAVGNYTDTGSAGQGVIFTETNGSWATGMEAPLPANEKADPEAGLSSVDCASSGNCVAVGGYTDNTSAQQGLILTLAGGTWTPTEVSPPAGADANPGVNLRSVSCVAAGSCAAVGNYKDTSLHFQGLLLTDDNGTWTTTKATLPLNAAADPAVSLASVSCSGTLDCAAAGKYLPNMSEAQGLLISATNGSWATGTQATLPSGGVTAQPNAISCASAGNCTAVGYYVDGMNAQHGLLLTETGGSWANGVEAPLPPGASNPSVLAVSCWAPGNCGAVGNEGLDGLLLGESGGSWSATDATLPSGGTLGDMSAVSCPGAAICTAGGSYRNSSTNNNEGLFVSAGASLASPTLALAAPASGTAGTAIAASAISGSLSGASAPAGSVSFTVFGPQSSPPANCSSGGTTVGSGNASGVTGIHPSAGFTPGSAGDYWWYARYGGDPGNNPSNSPCGAGMPETVVAAAGPGGAGGGSGLAPQKPRASGQHVSDTMTCRGGERCSVTLKLTITYKVKERGKSHRHQLKTVVLGSKSATIAAGQTQTVTVPLNAAGTRLLALHHVLVVKLSVIFHGKTVAVYALTVRARAHHKK